jgi:peptidoglycan hydrolase-like protein with peptidoglycan-binding domain
MVVFLVAATLLGILILGEQTDPPDMTAFEQQVAAGQDGDTRFGAGSGTPEGINRPRVQDAVEAPPARRERVTARGTETRAPISNPRPTTARGQRAAVTEEPSGAQPWGLNGAELVEMERLLARLDLEPSSSDGIVDRQTKRAIRLYQQIAGLPVDGAPSQALLTDMREVVKILDSGT